MKPLATDTGARAEEVQIGIWRSWTPEKRLECACSLLQFLRRRVDQAIRDQYPKSSEDELRIHFLRRAYGEEVAARVAGFLGVSVDA